MSGLVVDASVAMVWCFPDEHSALAFAVLDALELGANVSVPSLWHVEVANALLMGERRKRLTPSDISRFFALMKRLAVKTDLHTASQALGVTLELARVHGLTVYDATYLELAMREGFTLATLDNRLKAAAEQVGVPIYVGAIA